MRKELRGFFGLLTLMLAGLLILMACQHEPDTNPVPSVTVFEYQFSDITAPMHFTIPGNGIALDDWCIKMWGMSYEDMRTAKSIPPLYKDKALTQPFFGSDMLYAYTMLYSKSDLIDMLDQMGKGEKIGEITGTITLTNIPSPAPKVYILYNGNDWWSRRSRIDLSSVKGTSATNIRWTIPLYEGDDENNYSSPEPAFYYQVVPSGSAYSYIEELIPLAQPRPINSQTEDVGFLGSVSVGYITLSGTFNGAYNGRRIPRVLIQVKSLDGKASGSALLASPGANAPWSIMLWPLKASTPVYFIVNCSSDTNELLKQITIDFKPQLSVFNQNISGISLNAGELKSITLSGTFNGAYNGRQIPRVVITVTDNNDNELGSKELASPGENAPWSITRMELDSSTRLFFKVKFYSANGYNLFERTFDFADSPVSAHKQNVAGIILDPGNITFNKTLSGTFNGNYNGQKIPRVLITVKSNDDQKGWLGDTPLVSPDEKAPWSITLSPWDPSIPVFFSMDFYPPAGDSFSHIIYPDSPVYANQDRSGITLDVGDIADIPVPLTAGIWKDGTIAKENAEDPNKPDRYSIDVIKGTKYYLWWNDVSEGDHTKTLEILVYAYDGHPDDDGNYHYDDEIHLYYNGEHQNDSAWDNPVSFTAAFSGLVYIHVWASPPAATGTYAIMYNTTGTRP